MKSYWIDMCLIQIIRASSQEEKIHSERVTLESWGQRLQFRCHRPRFGALPQAGTDEGRPSKELLPGIALPAPVFWTSTFKNCQTTGFFFFSVWNQPVSCYTIYDYYGLKDTDSRQSIIFLNVDGYVSRMFRM